MRQASKDSLAIGGNNKAVPMTTLNDTKTICTKKDPAVTKQYLLIQRTN